MRNNDVAFKKNRRACLYVSAHLTVPPYIRSHYCFIQRYLFAYLHDYYMQIIYLIYVDYLHIID